MGMVWVVGDGGLGAKRGVGGVAGSAEDEG